MCASPCVCLCVCLCVCVGEKEYYILDWAPELQTRVHVCKLDGSQVCVVELHTDTRTHTNTRTNTRMQTRVHVVRLDGSQV